MEKDMIVTLSVFGGLLLVNIISLILVYVTSYGKSWIYENMKSEGKGYFIFWNFWMILTGITFWGATLFEMYRYGPSDYSKFDNVSVKELMEMLESEWAKKK